MHTDSLQSLLYYIYKMPAYGDDEILRRNDIDGMTDAV